MLANVLLRKNGGEIEFTTSDLEIQVRTTATFDGDAASFSTTSNVSIAAFGSSGTWDTRGTLSQLSARGNDVQP